MFGSNSRSGRRRPDFFCLAFLAGSAIAAAPPALAQAPVPKRPDTIAQDRHTAELPQIPLRVDSQRVTAEVAADDASRARGLMHRKALLPDHGMLFVFPRAQQQCFWMKNTLLPLTVAFIDTEGAITSTADMQPHSLEPHCSVAPVQYALEMEQGWFARHGAWPGTRIHGLPGLPPPAAH
ncbi:DUF192 domain-containing protein [Alcaligenaceae bacterium]|nr:DUF192 domain-containing protein [Alcaligenaceae bacterium]